MGWLEMVMVVLRVHFMSRPVMDLNCATAFSMIWRRGHVSAVWGASSIAAPHS
jgi:hypothetical protein